MNGKKVLVENVNAPGRTWRYADARDADAPVADAYDRAHGCIVIVIEGAAA